MSKDFPPFPLRRQKVGHCGPSSLGACIGWLTGELATERTLARKAGRPWSVYLHGIDEQEICRAARAYKIKAGLLRIKKRADGRIFLRRLTRHLRLKGAAVLSVDDGDHWVAALTYLPRSERFLVRDPLNKCLSRWGGRTVVSRGWDKDDEEYFAILLLKRRNDSPPPSWRVTDLGRPRR